MRADRPVTAGLSRVARMHPRERARMVQELCRNQPAFRSLLTQVSVARGVAFGSGLALAVAIVLLVQGAATWWVSALVLVGLVGFVSVAVVLTDSRFDLLLAVLGAHRTDELHDRLVTDEVYGDDAAQNSSGWAAGPSPALPRTVQRRNEGQGPPNA